MPTLPDPLNLQRSTPTPNTSVASYRGGIAEHAQVGAAEATARIGGEIIQLADHRRNQLDELRVIEASTDLRKRELALTFDEKDGYQAIKGGDVIKRPVVQEYAAKYKEETDKVTASLSPRQRELFAGHAASTSMNFQANVMRHAMAETEKYGGEVYKADLLSRYDVAGMSYKNDMVTKSQLEGIDAATHRRMDLQGVNDPALRDEFVKSARGGLHATVIDKAITAGDTEFANTYFVENKKDMTGDQRNAVERQLKPATDFAAGKAIASDAFREETRDPQFNAAQFIAEKAGSNPQIAAAAHSLYVQFVQEKKTAELEQVGTIYKQFYSAPTRATMNALVNSPEFRNLNDVQQANALHTMSSQVQSAEDRVVSLQDRAENKIYRDENREYTRQMHDEAAARRAEQKLADSLPAVTKTNEIARSPNLIKMKPEEIYGLAPEIGIDNVKYLLGRQAQTNKELNAFNMDKQIVEGAKPPSAMKNKVQSKAIDEMAELEGQKFIQTYGVKPDRDQQVEIMRKVTSESIEKTSTFGPFSWSNEKKLYELPPEQRNFYLGIQSAAKKAGRPALTDEQLVNAWDLAQKAKENPTKAAPPAITPSQTSDVIEKGNINLNNRLVVKNSDGSISTVRSIGVNIGGVEVLIPTVVNGKVVSEDAAIAHYKKTGEHLGKFKTVEASNAYAEKLHKDQEALYVNKETDPLQDPAFKARQAALQKANQDNIAATNSKTEQLKAELAAQEAKLTAMDAELNTKIATVGSNSRTKAQNVERAAYQKMDAEIAAKPKAGAPTPAEVSAYPFVNEEVSVTDLGKTERELTKKVEEVTRTPATSTLSDKPATRRSVIEKMPTTPPKRFTQPVDGAITPVKSVTRGTGGISIEAAANAVVKAAADGVVRFADRMRSYGNVVIVEHPGGYMTVYGHNNEVNRKVGDTVRAGEQLGTAQGGPTLFEVRHKGITVDPTKWLKKVGK